MTIVLAIIGVALLIVEALTISTLFIWISIGFFSASFVSIFNDNIFIILIFGVLATFLSMGSFRPKYLKSIQENGSQKTSFYDLVGQKIVIKEDYTFTGTNKGIAEHNSITWNVIALNVGESYKKDEIAIIKEIKGSTLVIEKGE